MPILLCNKIGEWEFFDQEHTKWLPQIVNWEWTRVIKIELSPPIIDSIKNNRHVCIKNVNPLFSEHHLIDLLFIMDCGVRSSVIYLLKEQVGLYHINSWHIFDATKKSSAMLFLSKSLCLVLSRSSLPLIHGKLTRTINKVKLVHLYFCCATVCTENAWCLKLGYFFKLYVFSNLIFECLPQRVSRGWFKLHVVSLLDNLYYILFGFFDGFLNLRICLRISNSVPNTNWVT